MDGSIFDEDYFIRGKSSGKSLYENYRYLPSLTMPMVGRIADHLGIAKSETILDFGCARGYVVRAFRELGYEAYGVDCSAWAIANADVAAFPFIRCRTSCGWDYDWIIAKDVLEHIEDVGQTVDDLIHSARKGILAIVPLSACDNQPYVIKDYEHDVTHCQRMTLPTWTSLFVRQGWTVTAQYRLLGVKDNWYMPGWEKGNGFLTARRIL